MPTDRFYRLPKEKRQIIREAAIKEFARVPFERASINQIIQNADISRGSFYTYFSDKQDVVAFIFEDSSKEIKEHCRGLLKDNHGNVFYMMEKMFEYFLERLQTTTDMMNMARNIFSYQENANAMGFGGMPEISMGCDHTGPIYEIYEMVDRSGWRCNDQDEFGSLMTMCFSALMISMAQFYKFPDRKDEIHRLYKKELEILQYGVLEQGNN